MKKKLIGLFIIVFIAVAGINIYMSNQRFDETGIAIILQDETKEIFSSDDFEKASPENKEISITRKNGDVITNTYYAVDLSTALELVTDDYTDVQAVAADYFSAAYQRDELKDNVYLAYNKEANTFEIVVAHDEFATRCVKDMQEIILK